MSAQPSRKRARSRSRSSGPRPLSRTRGSTLGALLGPARTVRMGTLAQIPSMRVKLIYGVTFGVTCTTGVSTSQQFRLNSVYDPDQTGGGNQPAGFDQFAALYKRYIVHGCNARICLSQYYGYSQGQTWCVSVSNNSAASQNMNEALSQPGVKFGHLGPGDNTQFTSVKVNLNKLRGKSPTESKADDSESALVTGNPSESLSLYITLQGDTAVTISSVNSISLIYDVEFFERKDMPQS